MALMWMGMLGAFVLGSHGVLWLDESLTVSLAREDGPFEYGTAAIFLVASLSAAVLFARSESGNDLRLFRTRRNVFYLLLSLLFAFGAGEEISWGQRIIEFDTPEAIRRINVNGEFNIHNLWLFDRRGTAAHSESPLLVFLAMAIDRMFSMFWLTYCVLIPILNHAIGRVARFARHINLPIPPIWIGVLFPINYLCSRIHPPWPPNAINTPARTASTKSLPSGMFALATPAFSASSAIRSGR